jgi:hypothetical protein
MLADEIVKKKSISKNLLRKKITVKRIMIKFDRKRTKNDEIIKKIKFKNYLK